MEETRKKPLYGKVIIEGKIILKTGLHIGASREAMEIGGLDAPVIRHPVTREPYIPGSSLKGKLRALMDKKMEKEKGEKWAKERESIGSEVKIHVCNDFKNASLCPLCRIFGSSGKNGNFPARLKVRDCRLINLDYLKKAEGGLLYTEWKFENAVDRVTAAANPRQIERVPEGAEFELEMIYDVEDQSQLDEDLKNILSLLELLEDDYLGGHGSRGYGKVKIDISSIKAKKIEAYMEEEREDENVKTLKFDEKNPPPLSKVKQEVSEKITPFFLS